MAHTLEESLAAPIVQWVDKPGVLRGSVVVGTDEQDFGTLNVTLPGAAKTTRMLLLSSACSGGRKDFLFMNDPHPYGSIVGKNGSTLVGTPIVPAGWAEAELTGPGSEVITLAMQREGLNLWEKKGEGANETVKITVRGDVRDAMPGVYRATYCIQQYAD